MTRRRRAFTARAASLAVLLALVIASPAAPAEQTITGNAAVVAGDLLDLGTTRVRLADVDAPGLDQRCGAAPRRWRCGWLARIRLVARLDAETVTCTVRSAAPGTPVRGECTAGGESLSAWLVASGWALARSGAGPDLGRLEHGARDRAAGIWRGGFVPSAQWRVAAAGPHSEAAAREIGCDACTLRHRTLAERRRAGRREAPSDQSDQSKRP